MRDKKSPKQLESNSGSIGVETIFRRDPLRIHLLNKIKWFKRQQKYAREINAHLALACWTGAIQATEQILYELRRK